MKMIRFDYSSTYGNTGSIVRLEDNGVEMGMTDFKPSAELIAMIEKEAEAEITRRRESHV